MLRIILLSILAITLILAIAIDTKDNKVQSLESSTKTFPNTKDDNEDYGCLHEDHSQYEDGDGLNLEAANYVLYN